MSIGKTVSHDDSTETSCQASTELYILAEACKILTEQAEAACAASKFELLKEVADIYNIPSFLLAHADTYGAEFTYEKFRQSAPCEPECDTIDETTRGCPLDEKKETEATFGKGVVW